MTLNNKKFITLVLALAAGEVFIFGCAAKKAGTAETTKIVNASIGSIKSKITSTGTVQPKNRVEIRPTTDGRVEDILVNEGDHVKKGQILAWMSSQERASLLDAARAKGSAELKYWQDVYKPTPLIAPIDGEVIVRAVEPGQSVTVATAVLVLSDQLIVVATVDETDIGKVLVGQNSLAGLDAYPDVSARGKVDHISYESKTVNNVTTYEVDIIPEKVPSVFRSGMTANVTIFDKQKANVLVLPLEAVTVDNTGSYVSVDTGVPGKPEKRKIETGLNDLSNIEIVSGITEAEKVIVTSKKFALNTQSAGTNPFFNAPRARTTTGGQAAQGGQSGAGQQGAGQSQPASQPAASGTSGAGAAQGQSR